MVPDDDDDDNSDDDIGGKNTKSSLNYDDDDDKDEESGLSNELITLDGSKSKASTSAKPLRGPGGKWFFNYKKYFKHI